MISRLKSLVFLLVIVAFAGSQAKADPISGTMWSVPSSTADNVPTLGNTPGAGATEWGTFSASAIHFSGDSNYSIGGFLNSFGAASNIVYMNGASAGSDLTDVLFEFTGTAYFTNGQIFNVEHDDGVNLYVNGVLALAAPSVTAPITTPFTYTGPTGNFSFDFIYANGPPTQADFTTNLVSPVTLQSVPEPSSIALLLTGSTALWSIRRRVARKNN
jgi:hypothetical protein